MFSGNKLGFVLRGRLFSEIKEHRNSWDREQRCQATSTTTPRSLNCRRLGCLRAFHVGFIGLTARMQRLLGGPCRLLYLQLMAKSTSVKCPLPVIIYAPNIQTMRPQDRPIFLHPTLIQFAIGDLRCSRKLFQLFIRFLIHSNV